MTYQTRNDPVQPAERSARRLCGQALFLFAALTSAGLAEAAEGWYLLEIAKSQPPCADVPEETRCLGTRPKMAVFEIRDGERIEMPHSGEIPPAWARLNQMWVYASAATATTGNRFIELVATPAGVRLLIEDRGRQYLQSVSLGKWEALDNDADPKLWVRVTAE